MSGKILTKTGLPILLEKKGSATFGTHRLLRREGSKKYIARLR